MKPPLPDEVRNRVLELRRTHSLGEVAKLTGVPLGTVKTICSRSGAFRDNEMHRAMFTLPPIKASDNTALAVPELPPVVNVTGDKEVDAVLWIREVIATGDQGNIDKAMEAAKRLKTPLTTLEERYKQHIRGGGKSSPGGIFGAIGMADLEKHAGNSIYRANARSEALERFGSKEALLAPTPAEEFCLEALDGLEWHSGAGGYDRREVAVRFKSADVLMPHTLADCLHEEAYWHTLYKLRVSGADENYEREEVTARQFFVFGLLGEIRPRTREESVATIKYLCAGRALERTGIDAILLNLVG